MNEMNIKLQSVEFNLVSDNNYEEIIYKMAAKAKTCFLASIFIADTHSTKVPAITHLAQLLGDAIKRGLFIRIILGGSDNNFILTDDAFSAKGLFNAYGVPCRIASINGISSHKKLIISDEYVLLGSHNWSEAAWTEQLQDSVLIKNAGYAALMADIIRRDWLKSSNTEDNDHV